MYTFMPILYLSSNNLSDFSRLRYEIEVHLHHTFFFLRISILENVLPAAFGHACRITRIHNDIAMQGKIKINDFLSTTVHPMRNNKTIIKIDAVLES
jgi:hypothetical protein